MRKGNSLYDEVFGPKGSPFLSVFDVVAGMKLDLAIPQYGELGLNTTHKAEEEIAQYLKLASSSTNKPLPAVFTAKGKSLAVVFTPGQCFSMDSHAHGRRGDLLASTESVQSCVQFYAMD